MNKIPFILCDITGYPHTPNPHGLSVSLPLLVGLIAAVVFCVIAIIVTAIVIVAISKKNKKIDLGPTNPVNPAQYGPAFAVGFGAAATDPSEPQMPGTVIPESQMPGTVIPESQMPGTVSSENVDSTNGGTQ